jgi:hypothetical protein
MKLALAALFLSLPALAAPIPNGRWTDTVSNLTIDGHRITLDKDHFELGKESISEAYAVGVSGFLGGNSTECRATTVLANLTPDGDLVLLRLLRSKTSMTAGLACGLSRDISKFSEPYAVEQIVLHAEADGSLTGTHVDISDGLDRPKIDIEQWTDPAILDHHPEWKAYIADGHFGRAGAIHFQPAK